VCLFGSRRKVDRFSMAWVKLTELAEAIRPLMSALPPILTELMHHNEPSLRANSDQMQRSKKSLLNRLVGARERRWRHVERDSRNETLWKVFPIFGRDFIPAA
jgi:hypothetical protein